MEDEIENIIKRLEEIQDVNKESYEQKKNNGHGSS